MKRDSKTQIRTQTNQQNHQQQSNQPSHNQLMQQQGHHPKKQTNENIDQIEDIKKRGWKGEQLFSFNEKNSSGLSQGNSGSVLVGQIYYENHTVCSASLISHRCLISITKIQLKIRPQSLKFRLSEQQNCEIESFEQKEIENYNLIVFKLKHSIGDKIGYFGVITYLDRIFYEQFDLQNKKKTISIPFYLEHQYITDITDDSVIIMKNKVMNQNDEEVVEFLGLPLIASDPFLGLFIIGLVVKSASTNFKAILLQQSHLQFLKKSVINKDSMDFDYGVKEDKSVIKGISKLESRVIYQSNGDLAHKDGIYTLCRLNNSCLASSSVDKTIRVWDWKGQTLLNNLDCDGCCRYFVCEDNMLVGTSENYVIIIDWHSRKIEGVIPCKNKLYSLLIYKHRTIFAGDCYGNINIINNSNLMYYIRNHDENPRGHRGSVNVMHKINHLPNLFFTAGEFGEIKVWDSEKFEMRGEMLGHDKEKSVYYLESYMVQNSSNNKDDADSQNHFLISGSSDKTIRIWNVQTFQQIKLIQLINPIYAACMINQNEIVIGDGSCIRIMNIHNQSENINIEKHESRVNAICKLSETSFASGDIEGSIITWSLKKPAILIQDGGDNSPASSYYQEKDTSINSQQAQQKQQKQQPISNNQTPQMHKQNNQYNTTSSTTTAHSSENATTIKKANKPSFGYEEQTFEIIENENEQKTKNQQILQANQSPMMTALPGPPPQQNQQQPENIQLNDLQFSNPFFDTVNSQNKGILNGNYTNSKKPNNLIQPQSTQNSRQPPQQKLNVEFFKEDLLNNNNITSEAERGRGKTEKQLQNSQIAPLQLNQIQDYKNAHYNDKSPQAYKRAIPQKQQQNNQENQQNQNNFQSQQDAGQQQGFPSSLKNNPFANFLSQKQMSQPQNNNDLVDENGQLASSFNDRANNQRGINTIKNNSSSFNTLQTMQGYPTNIQDLNSSKFQNQNSFVDLLKQFDDKDKYQIIYQRKLGQNISPLSKGLNNSTQNVQQYLMSGNQQQNKQPIQQLKNQELKELQQHYDNLIEQYLSSKSNKNQKTQTKELESNFPQNGNSKGLGLALDTEMIEKEYEIAQKLINPELQQITANSQQTLTPKSASYKTSQTRQKEIIIEFDLKEGDTSYMKNFSKNQIVSPINKNKSEDQRGYENREVKEESNPKQVNQALNQPQQSSKHTQFNKQEDKDKDLYIEKLFQENKELKEQVQGQGQQIEKYQQQIQLLIDTLQKSEEERIQMVNEIKQITPQLSRYSEITSQLREKSENQNIIIKKQDEEVRDLKDYVIDLQNEIQRLKQNQNGNGFEVYQEEEVSLNPIQNHNNRNQEDKRSSLLTPPQQQTEPIYNELTSEEQQNPSQHNNNFIHISEFSSIDERPQKQFQNNIESSASAQKQDHSLDLQDNTTPYNQLSPSLSNREQIMMQLRILQQKALHLHKQILNLKSKTSDCTNETEMIALLNELQKTHSLYETKNDEISELKSLYNLY